MSNLGFLFTGFTVAWALVFGYVWMLARRSGDLESRLQALERKHGDAAS
jgi:CcmD family protein